MFKEKIEKLKEEIEIKRDFENNVLDYLDYTFISVIENELLTEKTIKYVIKQFEEYTKVLKSLQFDLIVAAELCEECKQERKYCLCDFDNNIPF